MSVTFSHAEALEQIKTLLQARYIFPETAQQMNTLLDSRLPAYTAIEDPAAFANAITEDLQSISHDKHLHFRYDPANAGLILMRKDEADITAEWQELGRENYGFSRVEWLRGGIGYFDLRLFAPTFLAGDLAVAAMNFFANVKALIIDLRKNGGGEPEMVQLIASYLFSAELQHLNSIYVRHEDKYTHYWTLPYVPGKRLPDIDVYILTSRHTYSGGEDLAYNLQALGRATVIGETTGGAANPGDFHAVSGVFTLFVPDGRPISPITQTNWEGTGVTPDIQVPADEALKVAHRMALEKCIERAEQAADDTERKRLQKALSTLAE